MPNAPAAAPELIKRRTRHTRGLVLALLPFVAMMAPAPRPAWIAALMEVLGVFCLVVCLVGRGWTAAYIAGRKNREVVTLGPYSIVRNPLYVFSFIGLVGVALMSKTVTLLAIAAVCFVAYYRIVVKREEAHLARLHGEAFARYSALAPRWIPDFSRWRDASRIEVEPWLLLVHLRDSSLFFLSFVFFEALEFLRSIDALPVLVRLP
jgi:protein-S-isoprenylcysteine O-methyltransferase Ste14